MSHKRLHHPHLMEVLLNSLATSQASDDVLRDHGPAHGGNVRSSSMINCPGDKKNSPGCHQGGKHQDRTLFCFERSPSILKRVSLVCDLG
eukprot:5138969-Pyramimonas_sp.AAC.1